jgi:MFS transporter, DHA1 family, inner membrane transport protein
MKSIPSVSWIIVFALAAVNFTHIMDFMIIMPLGDVFMKEFGLTAQKFSIIVSAYTFSAGISGFLGVFWVDKMDRKKALMMVYAIFLLGTLACALSWNYETLLFARAISGAGGGVCGALVMSIITEMFPPEKRGSAIGIVTTAFSVASVAGVPFGLWLSSHLSWHFTFYFIVGIGSFVMLLLFLKLPILRKHLEEKKENNKGPFYVLTQIFEVQNQRRALFFEFILILGQFSLVPFIAPFLIRNVGIPSDKIFLLYLVGGIFTFFSAPISGKLTDKYGGKIVFSVAAFCSIFPIFALTVFGKWIPIPSDLTMVMIIAFSITTLFFIFVNGRMVPAQTLIGGSVDPTLRGSFMSLKQSVVQLSAGLAALVGGKLIIENSDGSFQNYWMIGVFSVCTILVTIFLAQKIKRVS